MDNEHADHAHLHLGHLVVVRVVHEGTVLPDGVLVLEGFAGLNDFLVEAPYSVHSARDDQTVPMDAGGFGQLVRDVNPDAISSTHSMVGP